MKNKFIKVLLKESDYYNPTPQEAIVCVDTISRLSGLHLIGKKKEFDLHMKNQEEADKVKAELLGTAIDYPTLCTQQQIELQNMSYEIEEANNLWDKAQEEIRQKDQKIEDLKRELLDCKESLAQARQRNRQINRREYGGSQ